MSLRLNDIKEKLIGFFEQHGQINTVRYEDDLDFAAESDITYPAAQIEYITSATQSKMITHSFTVTLADLSDDNIKGIEDEIHSDMIDVADDFAAWLWEQPEFVFDRTMNINKFTAQDGDMTAGITFAIRLSVVGRNNPCTQPTKI